MALVPTASDLSAKKVTFAQQLNTSLQRTSYKREIEAAPMWRANTSDSQRLCKHSRVIASHCYACCLPIQAYR